jgi:hypothetical protein
MSKLELDAEKDDKVGEDGNTRGSPSLGSGNRGSENRDIPSYLGSNPKESVVESLRSRSGCGGGGGMMSDLWGSGITGSWCSGLCRSDLSSACDTGCKSWIRLK